MNTHLKTQIEKEILPTSVHGIPCLVRVDTYTHVPPFRGVPQNAPSKDDYYGYTEIEFTILDRKGYAAPWLQRKLSSTEAERITKQIIEHHNTGEPDYD